MKTSAPRSASASVRAWVFRRVGRLPPGDVFAAALIDHAFGVAQDDVAACEPHGHQQLEPCDTGRTGTIHHQFRGADVAPGQLQGVDEGGRRDDRSAVLIVVKDRNVHQFAQTLLDHKAVGRLDVFEIDGAAGRPEITHRADEGFDIAGIDFQVHGIDIGEALEEDGLALHHGLGGERTQIAEPQYRGAVGNHQDPIGPGRVVIGALGICRDRKHRHGHARRIG